MYMRIVNRIIALTRSIQYARSILNPTGTRDTTRLTLKAERKGLALFSYRKRVISAW